MVVVEVLQCYLRDGSSGKQLSRGEHEPRLSSCNLTSASDIYETTLHLILSFRLVLL